MDELRAFAMTAEQKLPSIPPIPHLIPRKAVERGKSLEAEEEDIALWACPNPCCGNEQSGETTSNRTMIFPILRPGLRAMTKRLNAQVRKCLRTHAVAQKTTRASCCTCPTKCMLGPGAVRLV